MKQNMHTASNIYLISNDTGYISENENKINS